MKRFLLPVLVALSSLSLLAEEPKRVLVCTVTTGFRHSSIPVAEETLQRLAEEAKDFTITGFLRQPPALPGPRAPGRPRELPPGADEKARTRYEAELKKYEAEQAAWTPEKEAAAAAAQAKMEEALRAALAPLSPQNLREQRIDGVIFANTTGDLPLPDRDGFIDWIEAGHGFVAMHSGSDTLHGFPRYAEMLGGEFSRHEEQVPADLTAGDLKHPAVAGLPNPWLIRQEEVYQFKNHDRARVHVLWFLRHHPNHREQAETYAGVSWCRQAGQGRVFYTSLGHREDVWSDDPTLKDRVNLPEVAHQFQQHILGGLRWALGLAGGEAGPNPEVH